MTIATYMSRYHWILLVIIPRRNKVIYLDSLLNKTRDFTLLKGILDRYAHFLHKPSYFVVGFNDLFELFHLNALDVSLLRC